MGASAAAVTAANGTDGTDSTFTSDAGTLTAPAGKGGGGGVTNGAGGLGGLAGALPNALSSPNSDIEGGTTGTWTAFANCALASTSAQAHGGTSSLQMTSSASGNMSAVVAAPANVLTQGVICQSGDVLTVTGWLRTAVSARSVQVGAAFYDATGAHLSDVYGSTVSDSAAAWTQATAAVTAPANTARCLAAVQVVSTGAGAEVHYGDDFYIVNGFSFRGGNGSAGVGGSASGAGGGSAGSGSAGGDASGTTAGTAGSGTVPGAAGAAGSASNGNGAQGTAPGGGASGAKSGGSAQTGGAGRPGQLKITYTQTLVAFKTLIAHRPGEDAPLNSAPIVAVGNGADTPNGGTEYAMLSPITGGQADYGGTYTVVLVDFTWNTPANARDLTVTFKQYEYLGGPSTTQAVTRLACVPNTDIINGVVVMDSEITLPIRDMAADNATGYFTVTVTSSNTSDRFLDVLLLDTSGQLAVVNVDSGSGYMNYWLDIPDTSTGLGRILGSTFDRSQATSVLNYVRVLSGGPLTADPGDNQLMVYAVEGQPSLDATYYPHWWLDRAT